MPFKIGCHLSSAGGYLAMGQTAASIGANVFQFFTRNPRGGAAKPIDKQDVKAFLAYAAENGIGPILAHAPYTLNAAGAEDRVREFAEATMADDLKRLELTPGALYNFHPGSHVGQGAEKGIELISDMLVRILEGFGGVPSTTILLETMSGKGSEVGRDFGEVRAIIDHVETHIPDAPLGVCLDTCHVWDGGYDVVGDLDGVVAEFDRIVGLARLKAIHLNDSMNARSAHKDRHACIGKGKIGLDALARVINHPKLRDLPFYLETPCDLDGYRAEIALLKSLRNFE
ncbi:MAG: deoxyribonuclease IV [Kiritimatiellae bacterium]|nr:deoxyribonuclease IV [Kiritimatiellia bacterium]